MSDPIDQILRSTPHQWADVLIAAIRAARFTYADESELQDKLAVTLTQFGRVQREVTLSPQNRIDFVVDDDIGVEVKVNGSTIAALRQLQRYARTGRVQALILVTTCIRHGEIPTTISGIPMHVAYLPPRLA
jgi:hypothetical protein